MWKRPRLNLSMPYTHSPLLQCKYRTMLPPPQIHDIPQALQRRERSTILHPLLGALRLSEACDAEETLSCVINQS